MIVFDRQYSESEGLDEGVYVHDAIAKGAANTAKGVAAGVKDVSKIVTKPLGFAKNLLGAAVTGILKGRKGLALRKMAKLQPNEKSLKPVCNIDLQKIFALLHAKAVKAAEAKLGDGGVIENTAADGNDPENVVFHSAGEHMITARAKEEGGTVEKEKAIAAIREYVKIFCGADVEKGLNDKDFHALQEQGGEGGSDEPEVSVDERKAFDMTFTEYLVEKAGDGGTASPDGKTPGKKKPDQGDEADEAHDDEDEPDKAKEGNGEEAEEGNDENTPAADTGNEGNKEDKTGNGQNEKSGDKESAPGYFLLYGLKIKGMKESTAAEVLKRWGSNFVKGFSLSITPFFGSGSSGEISVGDIVKTVRGLFGAIDDPDRLAREVQEKIRKKFPKLECNDCAFRDKKTLIKDLDDEKRTDYNAKVRQKISSADYSLCIRIEKDNLIQPFVDRKQIANIVTMSIKGLFSAFKNMVKADDVILLHGNGLKYRDENKMYKLEEKIPRYAQVERVLEKAGSSNVKAYDDLEKRFEAIHNDKNHENSNKCLRALEIWDAFKKKYPSGSKLDAVSPGNPKKAFEEFLKEYAKFCNSTFGETIDVSESMVVAYDIIRSLFESAADFGDCVEAIFEDDPPAGHVSLTK